MSKRKVSLIQASIFYVGILILLIALSIPATVYADAPVPPPDNGTCISCHEDLYLLHDTGNWFCLKESPMTCVDCHGGDPNTLVKDLAHADRTPHPILNEDVSKCQKCHPDQYSERVQMFSKTAGVSKILVAAPYKPAYSSESIPVTGQQVQEANLWTNAMRVFFILFIVSIMLITYIIYRVRRTTKGKS